MEILMKEWLKNEQKQENCNGITFRMHTPVDYVLVNKLVNSQYHKLPFCHMFRQGKGTTSLYCKTSSNPNPWNS